jgi:hypothetical protein
MEKQLISNNNTMNGSDSNRNTNNNTRLTEDQKHLLLQTVVANQVEMIGLLCSLNTSVGKMLVDIQLLKNGSVFPQQSLNHHNNEPVSNGRHGGHFDTNLSSNYTSNVSNDEEASTASSAPPSQFSPDLCNGGCEHNYDEEEEPSQRHQTETFDEDNGDINHNGGEIIDYKVHATSQIELKALQRQHFFNQGDIQPRQPMASVDHVNSKLREQKVNKKELIKSKTKKNATFNRS